MRHSQIAALLAALVLASPAYAVDGVIEINHARALAGGVTASDTAGYPVTIDTGGSYRLTNDLTVPDENTTGISITGTAQNVTIDLNGFSITGPNACSGGGASISCTFGGGGHGILMSQGADSVRIMNGAIQGMGGSGIAGSTVPALVEGVTLSENGGHGIRPLW